MITMTNLADDLLMGADAIGDFLGVPKQRIYYLANTVEIPFFRMGSTVCARRSRLVEWVEDQEVANAKR